MKIEETESFIIFRDVSKLDLPFFKDFPLKLWFLHGKAYDNLFGGEFVGTNMDLSEYTTDSDDDLELDIVLYYFKKDLSTYLSEE